MVLIMLSFALEAGDKDRRPFRCKQHHMIGTGLTGQPSLKPACTRSQLLRLHLRWANSLCRQYVGNWTCNSNHSLKIQVEFHSKAKHWSRWGGTTGSAAAPYLPILLTAVTLEAWLAIENILEIPRLHAHLQVLFLLNISAQGVCGLR